MILLKRRFSKGSYFIFILLGIGIFKASPGQMIIALLVFGIIYLLYKFPPNRWQQKHSNRRFINPSNKQKVKKKPMPFRVIQGNKDRNEDEDEDDNNTPKFH